MSDDKDVSMIPYPQLSVYVLNPNLVLVYLAARNNLVSVQQRKEIPVQKRDAHVAYVCVQKAKGGGERAHIFRGASEQERER